MIQTCQLEEEKLAQNLGVQSDPPFTYEKTNITNFLQKKSSIELIKKKGG